MRSKVGLVGLTDEVVEAFNGDAVEVEVSGHATGFGGGFDEVDVMAIFGGAIGGSKTHGSCSGDDDFHAGSSGSRVAGRALVGVCLVVCSEFQTFGATLGGADSFAALGTLAAAKKRFELLPKIGEGWQLLPRLAMR